MLLIVNPAERNGPGLSALSIRSPASKLIMSESPDLPPSPPEDKTSDQQKVESAFASIKGLIKASLRPLPTETGDGAYITKPVSTGIVHDLHKLGLADLGALIETVKAQTTGDPTDDKSYLMERVIRVQNLTLLA